MRVRLQYGIDDSLLPKKIKELLQEVESLSELQNNKITAAKALLYSANNVGAVTQLVEDARRSLVDIDQSLADIHAIAKGYVDYLKSQEQPQAAPSTAQSVPKPAQKPAQKPKNPEPKDADMDDIITQMGQALQEQDQD